VNGLIPAVWIGVAVLAAGALVVLALPFSTRVAAARAGEADDAAARALAEDEDVRREPALAIEAA
jgi:hypothetical protein